MRDFKRIGGEILSSPLNENFRKLRDEISIANTNLVFSDEYGIVATVKDMRDLLTDPSVNVVDGQVCYVVSSGELYRYATLDNDWHKIADFGQTFNQVFLNSGVVLMQDGIRVRSDNKTLTIPKSLIYFKNRAGEDPFLKGMYLLDETSIDTAGKLSAGETVYSLMVDFNKQISIVVGIPKTDDPSIVFLGSFLVKNNNIYQEFVYTMPDMAYTADRGAFLLNGGQCSGAELYASPDSLNRYSGYYYDEGINYPGRTYYVYSFNNLTGDDHYIKVESTYYLLHTSEDITIASEFRFYPDEPTKVILYQDGMKMDSYNISEAQTTPAGALVFTAYYSIDHYPESLESTSNYNMLDLEGQTGITNNYYTNNVTPVDDLTETNTILIPGTQLPKYTHGIVYDKYYDTLTNQEVDVTPGEYTIQRHLITPSGQNILILGTEEYVDRADAEAHLNDNISIEQYFLYAEVTRIIVQNPPANTSFNPENHCIFYSLNRLSLAGSINPVFDDEEFKLFDGSETNPWFLQFKLDELPQIGVTPSTYNLYPMPYANNPAPKFGMTSAYVADVAAPDNRNNDYNNTYNNKMGSSNNSPLGYILPSKTDIEILQGRLNKIEEEIWKEQVQNQQTRYKQSVRYRLYKLENDIYNGYGDSSNSFDIKNKVYTATSNIATLETQKANKNSQINGYSFGDTSYTYDDPAHPYTITLQTGDIPEGAGRGSTINRWYTDDKVRGVQEVIDAYSHSQATGNPHGTTTDNIVISSGSNNLFMTSGEKTKLAGIPADTASQLSTLNNNKIEHLNLIEINDNTGQDGSTQEIKTLKVHSHGVNLTVSGDTATLECIGQIDADTLLWRSEYTPIADSTSGKSGYVDKALMADTLPAFNSAGDPVEANQYYGTDVNYGELGHGIDWYDLPVYVSTTDTEPSSYVNIGDVILQPEARSVALKHLADSRTVYGSGDEENNLGDNVYNLVKNHYHQVYNGGTQGPYIEDPQHPGTYIQDTSSIIYTYKVPYGGLAEHVYYLEYGNINYSFNTTNLGIIPVNTIMTYTPSSGNIEVEINGVTHTLTTSQVQPSAVNNDYFIEFIAQTDWAKINKWNFGNNLTVTVHDGIATINAFNASGDVPVHSFVNLDDVGFTYQTASPGQMLVINSAGNGVTVSNAPSLSSYMLISDYVNSSQPTKVNAAVAADTATNANNATTASSLQGTYIVNNSSTSSSALWTANKITTTISNQIATEGVRTAFGSDLPTAHTFTFTPKTGDLYILIE